MTTAAEFDPVALREALPPEMLKARRWLLHDSKKIPFYIDGTRRSGTLDTAEDVAQLATLQEALAALEHHSDFGIGFALGDGWQGIDLDEHRKADTGDLSALAQHIIAECHAHAEISPSGCGVHILGRGTSFAPIGAASNDNGIEAYSEKRYFTVTGRVLRNAGELADLQPVVERLRAKFVRVNGSAHNAPPPGSDGKHYAEGGRNDALTREAGRLRRIGLSPAALAAALRQINVERCDPPLPDSEVDTIARSVGRYPPQDEPQAPDDTGIVIGGALTLALEMEDLEFVISPMLTKGQKGTLTGHPGHCKTTFMTGLCVASALDRAFGSLIPESGGLVFVVSAEDFQGTRNRILAEAARLRLDTDDRARLDARLRWVHVETNVGAKAIKAAIETDANGRDVAMIFVDTGPALFSGDDENDNIALRNFVEGFAIMATLPGKPVTVLAWHPSKGATADRLEPRGASAIKASVDFNLTIWREDDRVSVGYTKVRGQHFDPFDGKLSAVELVAASGNHYFAPVITLDVDDKPERNDARQAREAILRRMYATRGNPPTVRDLGKACDLSPSAAGRHLQHLATSRPILVEKDPVDDRYTLTAKGTERAKALTGQDYETARDPG